MLKAYWIRLLLFALGGASIALIASQMVEKKYEAILDLLIDQKAVTPNISVSVADQSVTDLLDFVRSRSLTTQVQALTSYGTVIEACRRVGALNPAAKPVEVGDGSDLDPMIVMQNIVVTAEAQSDIISLRVRHKDPKTAQAIAREIYLAFSESSQRITRELAQKAIDKLKSMSGDLNGKLASIDKQVVDLKLSVNSPDLVSSVTQEITQIGALKTARDAAQFDVAALELRTRELESGIADIKKTDIQKQTVINPIYQGYETSLAAAELRLQQLRERFTDDREEIIVTKAEIESLKTRLKNTKPVIQDRISSELTNPLLNSLRAQITESKAALVSAQARYREAVQKVAEREEMLKQYPAVQSKYTELARQTASLERVKVQLDENLQVLEAAKTGRLAVVTAYTDATAFPDPVSPRTTINMLFGIAAGLIFGVLSMLATEAKRQPVRSLAQLNALSLKPVYRLVPELRQPYRGLSKAPAEAFDSLLANYLRSGNRPYRVAIVGLVKDSGASTAAINLAIAGSRHGARVLLVQCDPRGGMSRMSGKQPPAEGEFVEISPLVKGTTAESILTLSGDRNPEITSSIRGQEADLTVIDLEPTTKSAEYAFLAPHVDEVILLVRAGRSKSVEFLQAQQALKEAGCKQVTVAFTRSSDLAVVTESVEPDSEPSTSIPKSLQE